MISFDIECRVRTLRVPVKVTYSEIDPFEVVFSFDTQEEEEPINWVLDRGLLKEAIEVGESGAGDVLFAVDDELGHKVVRMGLSSPDGVAVASFDYQDFSKIVKEIYEAVSEDVEFEEITDEAIENWLNENS